MDIPESERKQYTDSQASFAHKFYMYLVKKKKCLNGSKFDISNYCLYLISYIFAKLCKPKSTPYKYCIKARVQTPANKYYNRL